MMTVTPVQQHPLLCAHALHINPFYVPTFITHFHCFCTHFRYPLSLFLYPLSLPTFIVSLPCLFAFFLCPLFAHFRYPISLPCFFTPFHYPLSLPSFVTHFRYFVRSGAEDHPPRIQQRVETDYREVLHPLRTLHSGDPTPHPSLLLSLIYTPVIVTPSGRCIQVTPTPLSSCQ